jgi:hypothetical protein
MSESIIRWWSYGGLLAVVLAVGSSAAYAEGEAGGAKLQDFEPNNGTSGGTCFQQIWNCTGDVEATQVQEGTQSLKLETAQNGGTAGIRVMGEKGTIDLSKAKKITLWVYDTQGDNTIELRIKDANGNGGTGPDGKTLWSATKARRNTWTKIEWELSAYPAADGLDLTQVSMLEVYEFNPGVYYFDDVKYE